jgi:molybdopterin synthase catalytic subunit
MHIDILDSTFEPYQQLAQYQQRLNNPAQCGASCIFIGSMRDFNDGNSVKAMTLEHYPAMTQKYLNNIVEQAQKQWAIQDCLLLHRVGEIALQEAIVLIAVWSAHRGDAFDSCRFIIEQLKKSAPFWKKEHLSHNQSRWVTHNSDGYSKE